MNDNLPPMAESLCYKNDGTCWPDTFSAGQMKAYARAAIEHQSVPALWAIHVPGPDDLYPAPSEEVAKHMAAKHNAAMTEYYKANPDTSGYRPPIESALATATAWTGNAADHAEEIAVFDYAAWGLTAPQPQPVQDPVATVQCIHGVTIGYLEVMQPVGTKLYTSPQAHAAHGITKGTT